MWTNLLCIVNLFMDKYYSHSHAFMLFEIKALEWLGFQITQKYNNHPIYSKLYKIYQCCVLFLIVSFLLTSLGNLYIVRNNIIYVGEDLFVVVGIGLILFKSLIYLTRFRDLKKMAQNLTIIYINRDVHDDRTKYRPIQDKYALLESLISAWFHVLSYLLGMAFIFVRSSNNLPLRALYPFDITTSPGYEVAFIYQGLAIFYCLNMITVMDGLACIYWHQISMHLLIISKEFGDIKEYCTDNYENGSDFKEQTKRHLNVIIMRHQYILELSEQLIKWTSPVLQVQIFASNFMICLTGFEVTLTLGNWVICSKFIMQMNSVLLQLLVWCSYGENVQTNSLKIATAVIEIPWYKFDNSFTKRISFILARSQKPVIMRAGPLYKLSLETFLSVLGASYSYFTILNTMQEKN